MSITKFWRFIPSQYCKYLVDEEKMKRYDLFLWYMPLFHKKIKQPSDNFFKVYANKEDDVHEITSSRVYSF